MNEDMESVEKEVRELILYAKSKRRTMFEPCTRNNLSEYLSYIKEECTLHGIDFISNPFTDLSDVNNCTQTMIRLVNATLNILMQYKQMSDNADKLKDRNYSLEKNNSFLNTMIEKLKVELEKTKNKRKQAEENERRAVTKQDSSKKELTKSLDEVKKLKKQIVSKNDQFMKLIKKLENENAVLQDRAKKQCGVYVSKPEIKHSYVEEYKAQEQKYKETIAKLQKNNRQLLLEVVSLKKELLSSDSDKSLY